LALLSYYRLHGGSISYWLPRSRIFLPHITNTPAMHSRIFWSRILHVFSPALSHFINTPTSHPVDGGSILRQCLHVGNPTAKIGYFPSGTRQPKIDSSSREVSGPRFSIIGLL